MQPTSASDYQQLLTSVIKKQIVILGPDITLSKARNVKGLTVANDGTVTHVEGSPQEVIQALIDQFVQLSGLIVKKTMEPLLSLSQSVPSEQPAVPVIPTPVATQQQPAISPQNMIPLVNPNPPMMPNSPSSEQGAQPTTPSISQSIPPVMPSIEPTQPTPTPTPAQPANNPLAA